jgi:hypothetical protein
MASTHRPTSQPPASLAYHPCAALCATPWTHAGDYGVVEGADGEYRAATWDTFCAAAVVPNAEYLASDLKKDDVRCGHRKLLM